MEEDDEEAWKGWDVDSASSESESEDWIDVEDNNKDLYISDSEDEGKPEERPPSPDASTRISTLATTKVGLLASCIVHL